MGVHVRSSCRPSSQALLSVRADVLSVRLVAEDQPRREAAALTQRELNDPGSLRRLVVFSLDGDRFAVPLASTDRVLSMVAVSPLPGCPDVVLGAINLHGDVVPVFDIRRRLGRPERVHAPEARLLIARAADRIVALPVDDVSGVAEVSADTIAAPETVIADIGHVSGIAALPDGLLLIHDLDAFLSIDEERQLDQAIEEQQG